MKILKYNKSSCIIFSVKLLGKFSKKKFELCQNDFIFTKIFELYQVTKLTKYSQKISSAKMH